MNFRLVVEKEFKQKGSFFRVTFLLTGMYADVVLVVGRAGEGLPAALLIARIWPLAGVRPNVDLAYVRRRERARAALERTNKWPLAWHTGKQSTIKRTFPANDLFLANVHVTYNKIYKF